MTKLIEMPASPLEIGIAGCGIGGMAAALFLQKLGHKITIFERFSEAQPVGSGFILQPTGQSVLRDLGLLEPLIDCGAPLTRLVGHVLPRQNVVLDVRYADHSNTALGLSVQRAALFDILYQAVKAAEADIELETDCNLTSAEISDDCIILEDADRRRFGPFDICIDALGTQSPLRALRHQKLMPLSYGAIWINIPVSPEQAETAGLAFDALQQRYVAARKMIGLMPIGRLSINDPNFQFALFWSLRTQEFEALKAQGIAAWKAEVSDIWPEIAPLLAHIQSFEQFTLARYAHSTYADPVIGRLAALGDAAHCTSPQLGQGANMALLDAAALAQAISERPNAEDALAEYARLRFVHRRFYQAVSRVFTPLYQSDSMFLPWLRDTLLAPMARIWPVPQLLAKLVVGDIIPARYGTNRHNQKTPKTSIDQKQGQGRVPRQSRQMSL